MIGAIHPRMGISTNRVHHIAISKGEGDCCNMEGLMLISLTLVT